MQAAIRAEELRGKASDLYINRTEMRTGKLDDLSAEELVVPSTNEEKTAANYVERTTYSKDKGEHKKDDKY